MTKPLTARIVEVLGTGTTTQADLSRILNASPNKVQIALCKLRDNGIVVLERRGRHLVPSLSPKVQVLEAMDRLEAAMESLRESLGGTPQTEAQA